MTSSYYRGAQGVILGEHAWADHHQSRNTSNHHISNHLALKTKTQDSLADIPSRLGWRPATCVLHLTLQETLTAYDVTRKETFDNLEQWLKEVMARAQNPEISKRGNESSRMEGREKNHSNQSTLFEKGVKVMGGWTFLSAQVQGWQNAQCICHVPSRYLVFLGYRTRLNNQTLNAKSEKPG